MPLAFLTTLRLTAYAAAFDEAGVETASDLVDMELKDLVKEFAMKKLHAKRLRKYLDEHTAAGASGGAAAAAALAAPPATPATDTPAASRPSIRELEARQLLGAPPPPPPPGAALVTQKEGYVFKARGGLADGEPCGTKWKKRWLVLAGGTLAWSKDAKHAGASSALGKVVLRIDTALQLKPCYVRAEKTTTKPKKKTGVDAISSFLSPSRRTNSHAFEFTVAPTDSPFPLLLACSTEAEREEWFDALGLQVSSARPRSPPPALPKRPAPPAPLVAAAKSAAREARRRSTLHATPSLQLDLGRRRSVMRVVREQLAPPPLPSRPTPGSGGSSASGSAAGSRLGSISEDVTSSLTASSGSPSRFGSFADVLSRPKSGKHVATPPAIRVSDDPRLNATVGNAIVAALSEQARSSPRSSTGSAKHGRGRSTALSLIDAGLAASYDPDDAEDDLERACLATTTVDAPASTPIPPTGGGDVATGSAAGTMSFRCTSYAPSVFSKLRREVWEMDEDDFVGSLSKGISGGGVGDGKSGMLFFFSHDRALVIKTLKKSELRPMLELLPDYAAHVRQHRNTLLCRYLALFCLTVYDSPTPPVLTSAPSDESDASSLGSMASAGLSEAMRLFTANVGAGVNDYFFDTASGASEEYIVIVMSSAYLAPKGVSPQLSYDLKGSTRNRLVDFPELATKGRARRESQRKLAAKEAWAKLAPDGAHVRDVSRSEPDTLVETEDVIGEKSKENDDDVIVTEADVRCGAERVTLKDLNLIFGVPYGASLRAPIALDPDAAAALHAQVECDTTLLSAHGLMDYSLLLGVHFIDPTDNRSKAPIRKTRRKAATFDSSEGASAMSATKQRKTDGEGGSSAIRLLRKVPFDSSEGVGRAQVAGQRATCFMSDAGGLRARSPSLRDVAISGAAGMLPPSAISSTAELESSTTSTAAAGDVDDEMSGCIFYLSIIDLLQRYDTSKTLETQLKRKKSQKHGLLVSSVPPVEYAERFRAFLDEVVPVTRDNPRKVRVQQSKRVLSTREIAAQEAPVPNSKTASSSMSDVFASLADWTRESRSSAGDAAA